jgi:phospholipase C
MYFAVAKAEFVDNALRPDSVGKGCNFGGKPTTFEGRTTIADLLLQAGHDFAFYAEGYDAMKNAVLCPLPPADCPLHLPVYPCNFDPSDIPFEYYAQFQDEPAYMKDYAALAGDLSSGALPTLTFVKGLGYHTEHPGYGTRISDGTKFVKSIVDAVAASPVAASTLVLVTWDEGGGYFDHVAPPPTSAVDSQPYGTRVPLIAVGPFARKNHVSHVPMEHSSIVRFVERAFLGATGQLGARDAVVEDIGSLLDPAKTSLATP